MKIDVAAARARPIALSQAVRRTLPEQDPKSARVAAGLTQFGVNLLELGPGAWSSQRRWHAHEDEFVYVVRAPSCS
jgi:uncharacterized cupin superfamily protein